MSRFQQIQIAVAAVGALAALLLWFAFVRQVPERSGIGRILAKDFLDAHTVTRYPSNIFRQSWTPTQIRVGAAYVFTVELEGGACWAPRPSRLWTPWRPRPTRSAKASACATRCMAYRPFGNPSGSRAWNPAERARSRDRARSGRARSGYARSDRILQVKRLAKAG